METFQEGQRLAKESPLNMPTPSAPGEVEQSMSSSASPREITVAHSPDSDDAFMFYALATNKVRSAWPRFSHTLTDIETLNRKALEGVYDVTAISFHAYPIFKTNMPCCRAVGASAMVTAP